MLAFKSLLSVTVAALVASGSAVASPVIGQANPQDIGETFWLAGVSGGATGCGISGDICTQSSPAATGEEPLYMPDDPGTFVFPVTFPGGTQVLQTVSPLAVSPSQVFDVVASDFGPATPFAFGNVTPFMDLITGLVTFSGTAIVSARDSAGSPGAGSVRPDVLVSGRFVDHVLFGAAPGEFLVISLLMDDLLYAAFNNPGSSVDDSFAVLFDCGSFVSGACAAIGTFIGVLGNGGGDGFSVLSTLNVIPVPVPPASALVAVGVLGLGTAVRRRPRR